MVCYNGTGSCIIVRSALPIITLRLGMQRMKLLISVLTLTFALFSTAQAREIADVDIPENLSADSTQLVLNGAGVRTKWFMDIYVSALYLAQPSTDATAIMSADEPMAVKLHMVSGLITSEKMKDAVMEGFQNATGGNLAPIQSHIDQFIAAIDEEIKQSDVFDLICSPGKGLDIYTRGKCAETVDGGVAFKEAVFGIWLSNKPAQANLKKAMLGG